MDYLVLIRLLSFGGMTLLSLRVPFALSQSVFFAVLFGHYVMQLIYSPRQLQDAARPVAPWRIAALLGTFLLTQYTTNLPMAVFFGVHFVFSELYTGKLGTRSQLVFWSRALTVSATYVLCCAALPEFAWMPRNLLLAALVLGFAGLGVALLRSSAEGPLWARPELRLIAYEAIGVPFALALPSTGRSELTDIIFVHLVWWFLYPLPRFFGAGRVRAPAQLGRYLGLTFAITFGFFIFTPAARIFDVGFPPWALLSILTGNIHITLSFALSAANPAWIRLLFQPRASEPLQIVAPTI